MKVLQVHKNLRPQGGSDIYVDRLSRQLAARGHEIALFGGNGQAGFGGRPEIDFDVPVPDFHAASSLAERGRVAAHVIWSRSTAAALDSALDDFAPDAVHLHGYAHQLSSSILRVLRRHRVRTVYTAHDYKLVCPAYIAQRKGKECFACQRSLSVKLLRDACLHDDRLWSGLAFSEAVLTRKLGLAAPITICPSAFMKERHLESWLEHRTHVRLIRNPVERATSIWTGPGSYLLYVGRLSHEKGVTELTEACMALGAELCIAGDGPLRDELNRMAQSSRGLVQMLGHLNQEQLQSLRLQARAQVLPSMWAENAPLAALEAAAMGLPIIATARGGMTELIELGARGTLMSSVDSRSLGLAMSRLEDRADGWEAFMEECSWETHLPQIERAYVDAAW